MSTTATTHDINYVGVYGDDAVVDGIAEGAMNVIEMRNMRLPPARRSSAHAQAGYLVSGLVGVAIERGLEPGYAGDLFTYGVHGFAPGDVLKAAAVVAGTSARVFPNGIFMLATSLLESVQAAEQAGVDAVEWHGEETCELVARLAYLVEADIRASWPDICAHEADYGEDVLLAA